MDIIDLASVCNKKYALYTQIEYVDNIEIAIPNTGYFISHHFCFKGLTKQNQDLSKYSAT